MGMTRYREVRPTVGLIPTRLFCWDGERMEPLVSVPREAKARPRDDATPGPAEEPDGSLVVDGQYWLCILERDILERIVSAVCLAAIG
jgi:hypothetical protein